MSEKLIVVDRMISENQKLVSVIITTHNRLNLLPRAIDSVLQQTYKNIECIVVDDASNDGTEGFCRERKNIQYIRIAKDDSCGGNYARNLGVKASNGEYVAFLDDDDYWLPQKLEKQVELMESKSYVLCSCGRFIEHVLENNDVKIEEDFFGRNFQEDLSKQILYKICTTTSLIMVKKKDLQTIGFFDEKLMYWQEYELCIRLAQKGKFGFVDQALVVYRRDLSDYQGLTNRYVMWPDTVRYIVKKHYALYKSLTFREFLLFQKGVCFDACNRLNKTNERKKYKNNMRVSLICNVILNRPHNIFALKCYILFFLYSYRLIPLWLQRKVFIA